MSRDPEPYHHLFKLLLIGVGLVKAIMRLYDPCGFLVMSLTDNLSFVSLLAGCRRWEVEVSTAPGHLLPGLKGCGP